jgi:5-methyltetrahydropteroyltriglutamate--homocysteine methyltransferase
VSAAAKAASPGRQKLKRLGLELPPFPLTSAGSFPKPAALAEAREKLARGRFPLKDLESLEKRFTEYWVRAQDKAGFDVLTDGEMYRGHMVSYFADHLPGFYPGGWVRVWGNRYVRKPVIAGEVRWPGPITAKWWRFAQSLTAKPVKAVITGPYTLMHRSFDDYHPTRQAACLALAQAMRLEAESLAEAGAKVLQVDESSLTARPEELPLAQEALERALENVSSSVYVVLHVCKAPLAELPAAVFRLPADNFHVESSGAAPAELRAAAARAGRKDLTVGAADAHAPKAENAAALGRWLRAAARPLGGARAWVGPDCGLRTLGVDPARAKLAALARAAQALRPKG